MNLSAYYRVRELVEILWFGCNAHSNDPSYLDDEFSVSFTYHDFGLPFTNDDSFLSLMIDDFCKVASENDIDIPAAEIMAMLPQACSEINGVRLLDDRLLFDVSDDLREI